MIIIVSRWVRKECDWVLVYPSLGRGEAPIKEIGKKRMRWKRMTYVEVGEITLGRWLVGVMSSSFDG